MAVEGKLKLNEETTELISRLVGRIVHDFNNPLAAIIGFADLLRNPNVQPEKMARYVGRIHEQAVKLGDMVENMAAFTSIPASQVAPMDLRRAASDVHALRCGSMERTGTRLSILCPGEPVQVQGDRTIVARILSSLLNNVEQTFKEKPGNQQKAGLECGRDARGPYVACEDNGPGVPDELQQQIFEPFFSTRRSGGLGLGLTVSRGLARRMGGDLVLAPSTNPEFGAARFVLYLPEGEEPQSADAGRVTT